ncbi:MAG: hypothetical protein OXM57_07260 [bacterium]|nr:hypothetical protein [bacterium]MDE0352475.1 hypothetical protein [bacterium]
MRAGLVGPSVGGELPSFFDGHPRGVTYTLQPDGSSVILWASSGDGLEEGDTALWVGPLTADELAAASWQVPVVGLRRHRRILPFARCGMIRPYPISHST